MGDNSTSIDGIETCLNKIDQKAESEKLTEEERRERGVLLCKLCKAIRIEEVSWRQNSRVKWLLTGDKNTAFFYAMFNNQNRRNGILKLRFREIIMTDLDIK